MYAHSTQFAEMVTGSHRVAVACDAIYDGATILADVPLVSGTVTDDRTRFVRRSGDFRIDPALAPDLSSWDADLLPKGTELRPRRGVILADGTTELIPLGVLVITDTPHSRPDGTLSVRAEDRATRMAEDEIVTPIDVSGMTTRAVIEDLVERCYPDLTLTWDGTLTNPTMPGGSILTGKASTHVESLAAGVGGWFYFDADGDPVVQRAPNLGDDTSVVTWAEGEGGTTITSTTTPSREGVWNAVAVTGEAGTGATAFGFATITSGSMVYGGPFGRVVRSVSAPNLTTDAACQALADDLVGTGVNLPYKVALTVVPHPAIQAGDIATVDGTTVLVDVVTVGMAASEPMGVSARTLLLEEGTPG